MPHIGKPWTRWSASKARVASLLVCLAAARLATSPLCAQEGGTPDHTADSLTRDARITGAEVQRILTVLRHDSLEGRTTPSASLERAARYVAAQFQALGLEPAGDSGTWLQRYPVPGHATLNLGLSGLFFLPKPTHRSRPIVDECGEPTSRFRRFDFRADAFLAGDTVLDSRAPAAMGGGQGSADMTGTSADPAPILVAGAHTPASVRQANIRDKVVVYIPASGSDASTQRQVVDLLRAANHVIVVADEDSAAFAAHREAATTHPPVVLDWYLPAARRAHHWVAYVWAPAIASGLAAAGFSLGEARTSPTPVVRELEAAAVLWLVTADSATGPTAPNVVGLLRGREARKLLVLTAHLDQAQPGRGGAPHGANDNAAGVAGLLTLAKAFQAAGVQPRRSILFAAVSGGAATSDGTLDDGEPELWGSHSLVWRLRAFGRLFGKPVLNFNLDMLDNLSGDSLRLAGLTEVELPVGPAWVAARLPAESSVTVIDGGSVTAPTSDHYAFVRKTIPSLFAYGRPPAGRHGDLPSRDAPSGTASAALAAEPVARALRFVYALTRELAEAERGPRWTTEGRRRASPLFDGD